ncbi:hypothetical protein CR513_37021, partial [Mucuna pruriens]
MGDLLGSPRVAPLFWVDLRVSSTVFCRFSCFSHCGGIHIVINRATLDSYDHIITNAPDPIKTPQSSELGREATRGIHIVINHATLDMCDHTNTNGPDPNITLQSSVLGRE